MKNRIYRTITGIEFKHTPLEVTNEEFVQNEIVYTQTEGYIKLGFKENEDDDLTLKEDLKTFQLVADEDGVCNIEITEEESALIKEAGGVTVKFWLAGQEDIEDGKEYYTPTASFELRYTNEYQEPVFATPEVLSAKFIITA